MQHSQPRPDNPVRFTIAFTRLTTLLSVAALLASTTACVTNFGPRMVQPARFNYNQAIANSHDQQLLLNLVRLRYRDTPVFLSVGSVLTQYTIEGSAAASVSDFRDTVVDVGAGIAYSEKPTITYTPLQGEQFARRMLTPVAPEALILLAQSGWSIERLALCCVEQMNTLRNAPSASGPTPDYTPRYAEFKRVARLLRELQIAGMIDLRLEDAAAEDDRQTRLFMQTRPNTTWRDKVTEIRSLLGLPEDRSEFRLTSRLTGADDEISIRTRSIYGTLSYLSQAVVPPDSHKAAGKVTRTPGADGSELNWTDVLGGIFKVHSSARPPNDAFVAVRYRDHWFFIADDDLQSKTTFNMVTLIFALQATPASGAGPLLTVNTGR